MTMSSHQLDPLLNPLTITAPLSVQTRTQTKALANRHLPDVASPSPSMNNFFDMNVSDVNTHQHRVSIINRHQHRNSQLRKASFNISTLVCP